MSKDIRIKKGLDIKLVGESERTTTSLTLGNFFGIRPDDFYGVIPKILAKEGTIVEVGQALFYDKSDERILFTSPVSGKICEIVRGARRKVLEIKIATDNNQVYKNFDVKKNIETMSADDIKTHLLNSGCWPFIKQRPYDVVASPNQTPKSIFISGHNSGPLAPDYDYILKGKSKELQIAVTALSKLTSGSIHVSVASFNSPLSSLKNVEVHNLYGPHPVGNVSTQIAKIDPINKGEIVWVITPQDLVVIGELLLTGRFNLERTIALCGSQFKKPKYVNAIGGAQISDLVGDNLNDDNTRIISGNVLSGLKVGKDDFIGYYDNQITAIPEGNDYDFFGWNKPIFNKISISRALTFSWLNTNKKYDLNTNKNGEQRAFVVTGSYEEVFPLDIYPMQLLKACMYKDLDEMEGLGAYEIAPEDFALTEFVCVSKQPHQKIIREGLDLMRQEIG